MDFELSDEQVAFRDSARSLIGQRWDADRLRKALDSPAATIPDELWSEIASLGWLGIASPHDVGGSGGDLLTAALLAEEAGRGLLPGPFAPVLATGIAIDRSGHTALRNELLPGLFAGTSRAVCAFEEPGGAWGPDAVTTRADRAGGSIRVDGLKILVADADSADVLLVAARTPDGLALIVVPRSTEGVELVAMNRFDGQSMAEVGFTGVTVPETAVVEGVAGTEQTARDAYDIATVLCAADLLGVAGAVLDLSTTYAKDRVQFGRPIGSFQAISHRLADVLVAVEIGRSLVHAACLALSECDAEAPLLVSAAKAWMSDTAVSATETALHVHGGIGFTWELDIHLYLRRARSGAASFGDADFHRGRIAAVLAGREEALR